jgi:ribosomal protein S18 acetylase RimI-like enzyme
VTTVQLGDSRHIDGAAQVWAEATAARDRDPGVAPLELSRPVIARAYDRPGAVLVVALDPDDQVVAFAVADPLPADAEPGAPATTAEVRYVGVRPGQWGAGLGRSVLRLLCAQLAAAGLLDAQLMVYVENDQAVRFYEQLGWSPDGSPVPHPRTGKPEQRYRLRLAG